ncbi:AMPN-like protein [Mya arenaria]|uniref:AMPN-like protein n=1 Tax=Mya arenaria TaxID=6604 RepID=A0ABY7GAA7_MYAAR|nr:AMPN-like protein [Mya arenaria]
MRSLVASQLQSTDARKVFPCFDEPAMKATFTVSITHDASYTALSNMPVRTVQCVEECTRRRAWFGNMVTMKWWSDLWLNEGFASTLMYFAMDHEFPEWNVLEIVVVEDMFPVMVKDALVTSHPVSPNIEHPDEIAESFDQISYNKGMAILRMLETFLGKEGFRLGLQAMNYTVNISSIMDTWTRQMGYPVIHVRRQDGFYILEQERFLMDTPTAEDTPSKVPIPEENSSGWILGNLDYGGFYRVNYELDMWGQLGRQLNEEHSVFSLANRAGLIGDAFNLARASRVDYGLAFNMTTYLAHEDNYVPWKAFLDCIDFIQGMLSKTSAYVLLQKYIGNLVSPVIKKIGMVDGGNLPQITRSL